MFEGVSKIGLPSTTMMIQCDTTRCLESFALERLFCAVTVHCAILRATCLPKPFLQTLTVKNKSGAPNENMAQNH